MKGQGGMRSSDARTVGYPSTWKKSPQEDSQVAWNPPLQERNPPQDPSSPSWVGPPPG